MIMANNAKHKREKRVKDKKNRAMRDTVLDQRTLKILSSLEDRAMLFELSGTVSSGKEANVYVGLASKNLTSKFINSEKFTKKYSKDKKDLNCPKTCSLSSKNSLTLNKISQLARTTKRIGFNSCIENYNDGAKILKENQCISSYFADSLSINNVNTLNKDINSDKSKDFLSNFKNEEENVSYSKIQDKRAKQKMYICPNEERINEAHKSFFNINHNNGENNYHNGLVSLQKQTYSNFEKIQRNPNNYIDFVPCAIKIYQTSIMQFKDRLKYIISEKRFKTFCSTNPRKLVKLWAEKEVRNLKRLNKFEIPAPKPIYLKNNVLIMDLIMKEYCICDISNVFGDIFDFTKSKEETNPSHNNLNNNICYDEFSKLENDLVPYDSLLDNTDFYNTYIDNSVCNSKYKGSNIFPEKNDIYSHYKSQDCVSNHKIIKDQLYTTKNPRNFIIESNMLVDNIRLGENIKNDKILKYISSSLDSVSTKRDVCKILMNENNFDNEASKHKMNKINDEKNINFIKCKYKGLNNNLNGRAYEYETAHTNIDSFDEKINSNYKAPNSFDGIEYEHRNMLKDKKIQLIKKVAPRLRDFNITDNIVALDLYEQSINILKKMYQKCNLIHSDFSEFNLLVSEFYDCKYSCKKPNNDKNFEKKYNRNSTCVQNTKNEVDAKSSKLEITYFDDKKKVLIVASPQKIKNIFCF
ncbi:hypothetical protein EDEG_00572 [Edhazardia aedis USNM 41457]|uniref:non-specific serine/threonine protein kinase n=1 Tax=Edhazardia aedis (strain USNM 41457) TaxID=1003232 RepID=J9DIK6_EDHAE|nr:hypothetical protein EDEG_00572 [Edhazardia aedis USNM 41457]|eukprot:EJW01197.1 hypothetical protein EDEG_00572 [Edhazardia aedis USNM 41457]